jgi:hypothetical protein
MKTISAMLPRMTTTPPTTTPTTRPVDDEFDISFASSKHISCDVDISENCDGQRVVVCASKHEANALAEHHKQPAVDATHLEQVIKSTHNSVCCSVVVVVVVSLVVVVVVVNVVGVVSFFVVGVVARVVALLVVGVVVIGNVTVVIGHISSPTTHGTRSNRAGQSLPSNIFST